MSRAFPDFESTEGLGVGEKSRLEYDHTRQLAVTSFEQQQGRVEHCLLVFMSTAIVANEDLGRC